MTSDNKDYDFKNRKDMRYMIFLLFFGAIILFTTCANTQDGTEEIPAPPSPQEKDWELVLE